MGVTTLRPGLTLENEAAASWARMEHKKGSRLDVNRSTVPRAIQLSMFNAWNDWVAGRGPKPPHGRAIHPDYSWHCEPRARAVDTDDDAWIRNHPEYGWRFVVNDEKWHAQYYPELDKFRGTGFPAGNETEDEDEMPITILERKNSALTKSLYDVKKGRAIRAISKDENTAFRKARSGAVVYITVSDAEYKARGGAA